MKVAPNGDSLVISGLVCTFGGVRAVDGVDMVVPTGRVTGLVGPNGAGKSTVLNAIAGAVKPFAGSIRYRGEDLTGLPTHAVAQRGLIRTFQLASVFPHLTVLENLLAGRHNQCGASFLEAMRGKRYWRRSEATLIERARALLARAGMSAMENQWAGELSGGQKRMVEIMRAMMAEPSVLLLDEPFAGVNPTLARRVEAQLMALREEGTTMLMIEHDLGAVERLSDSVIMMAQGRVLAQGSMSELRSNQEVVDAYIGR